MIDSKLNANITEQRLPENFIDTVTRWYQPVAKDIADLARSQTKKLVIGVQGCQGSGKSTLSEFLKLILEQQFQLSTAVLSIDDFYLTKHERRALGLDIHPLLATRGVPGTHDVKLAMDTIESLKQLLPGDVCKIPRFNKAEDDRAAESAWDTVTGPVDIIIFEGWCVGIAAQPETELLTSINALEQHEDSDRIWRYYVNTKLANEYQNLFSMLDALVVLKAPSFFCVFNWRLLQEQKLIDKIKMSPEGALKANHTMSPEEVERFISHYQRLTEHAMQTLPEKADWLLTLDEDHHITGLTHKTHH